MGNHRWDREDREVVREVVEGQIFEISYSYNSSIGTYTYVKNYDFIYLEKVKYISHYNGKDGMTGSSNSGYVYFKAIKRGTTKIILGHEYRGRKNGDTSIKVKIKKNDGKIPIEKIEYKKQPIEGLPNKICIIGDTEVGKTNIINYLDKKDFNDKYIPTQIPFFINKIIAYKNIEIELKIFDTIGNEKFRQLNELFYKDSDIIILVYDITNKNSFEDIKNIWYEDVQKYCEEKPMILILGNKTDLFLNQQVIEEEATEYAKSINSKIKFISTKQGFPVDTFLKELIDDYLNSN